MMTDDQIAAAEAVAQENRDIVAASTRAQETYAARKYLETRDAGSVARAIDCSLTDIEKCMVRHKLSADAARAAGATEGVMQTVLEALDEVHHAFALLSLAVRGS